jgi:hypothetical protein
MSEDTESLVRMFHAFAMEFHGESPVYERLAQTCAATPSLGDPLLAAPRRQRRALLLFGAVQYLLRGAAAGHPLTAYFPVLGGDREPDDKLPLAFADLVTKYSAALTRLCASRTTQTNEARRSALFRPAFVTAAAGRPIGLVELGTSAGLLLIPDRYGYRYHDAARSVTVGAAPALALECEARGPQWPEPALADLPPIASRIGIDLQPIDATDPDAASWLRCLIWPEQVERLARLDAALAEVALARPRLIAGDMLDRLPTALSEVDSGVLPVVFASHAVTYLPRDDQIRLVQTLGRLGAERDLAIVLNEAPRCGIQLFSVDAPDDEPAGPAGPVSTLTLVAWRAGVASVTSLARTGPHGAWIAWNPTPLPYDPVSPE